MRINPTCARAVASILGAHTAAATYATAADNPSDTSAGAIQEVVVTAQRRTENVQDVPIAIQAFTGETL